MYHSMDMPLTNKADSDNHSAVVTLVGIGITYATHREPVTLNSP